MTVEEWLGKDNKIGQDIWKKKYQYNEETFDEWLDRITAGNTKIRRLIVEKKFLFGGRILSNRGLNKNDMKVTYSNCYVVEPPEDNIESIFECAKKMARTYSYGGGVGVDISNLSPRGAKVRNTAKETSGSVSFMELYSIVTALIGQNGRRGALMISLSCKHPDLLEFIGIKSNLKKVTKANISVRITNEFMSAVMQKKPYTLEFTRNETGEHIIKEVNAYEVFHKLCEMNWDYAEPGILFWDKIESWNLLNEDPNFSYAGTNPCAEEPLPGGGSCLLASINLAEFVKDDLFDREEFMHTVHEAVIALNDVLDEGMKLHPLKEQRKSVKDWRQIGLGIFGLADLLIKLRITYGSREAIELCDSIGFLMTREAIKTSTQLAMLEGSYPKFNLEAIQKSAYYSTHIDNSDVEIQRDVETYGLRNSQLLTIAPTGTLSTMLGVSGGIEPIFANYYTRKTESLFGEDHYYKVYTPIVQKYMNEHGITDDSQLPEFFITAQNLNYRNRIDMQAIWQKHIDASISSTVNVPNEFTVEQVEDLYMYAWEKGLKGVTIYRDGCKRSGILTTKEKKVELETGLKYGDVIKANDDCIGRKRTLRTGCGTLHCEAFFDPKTGALLETYFSKGSTGGCSNFMVGLSRMCSLAARAGVDVYKIADQLSSSGTCPSYTTRHAMKGDTSKGSSCPVAISYALIDMYESLQKELFKDEEELSIKKEIIETSMKEKQIKIIKCPQCGSSLIPENGCFTCKSCGYSKCE